MFKQLGVLVAKRPRTVIFIVLLITAGFGSFIPFIEMSTDFNDFMPDDPIVEASLRVQEYFGQTGDSMMIIATADSTKHVATPQALRTQYDLVTSLTEEYPEYINTSVSLAVFVDIMCQIEFGTTLPNCTDQQIELAYNDLLAQAPEDIVTMLETNDENEDIDYDPPGIFRPKQSIDSLDIKNYAIDQTNTTYEFTFSLYDLEDIDPTNIQPPHKTINVMEWYITFNNGIIPDERLNMTYTIAAHIEPTHQRWIYGDGIRTNIQNLFSYLRDGTLFNSYNASTYLWVQMKDTDFAFPLPLESANITFDTTQDQIIIQVTKEELSQYGIAPSLMGMSLPARIKDTQAGVRIYHTPLLNKPGGYVGFNVSSVLNLIQNSQNIPLIGPLSNRILENKANLTWEDFDELIASFDETGMLPDKLALQDLQNLWEITDTTTISDTTYYIKPYFIDQISLTMEMLQGNNIKNGGAQTTLILLTLEADLVYQTLRAISADIAESIEEYDSSDNTFSLEVTSSGLLSNEIDEVTAQANDIIAPGIFIIICLILLVMFQRISYMALPLIGLTVSIIWLFGCMVLLDIAFTVMMVAIVPLLLGLGVDYSVHLYHNYQTELREGKDPATAIQNSIEDIGVAMSLGTLTTMIAFLSFLTATIPPLRDFGLLCALGILFTFITTITLQAPIRYILDKNKTFTKTSPKRISLNRIMKNASEGLYHYRKVFLATGLIITVVMGSAASNVQTTFDMYDFLPEGNKAMELFLEIEELFPSSSQYAEYILLEGDVATVATLKGIQQTIKNIEDDPYILFNPDDTPKIESIYTLIVDTMLTDPSIKDEYNLNSQGIPATNQDAERLYDYLLTSAPTESMQLIHKDGGYYDASIIRIYYLYTQEDTAEADSTTRMGNLNRALNEDIVDYGDVTATVTGESSSTYTIVTGLTESQLLSTGLSLLLACLVLIIVYRSISLGIIAMIPVCTSLIWIVGTVYFIGYSFNIMTIMVTSLTIGMGIDYAIHATGRFRLVVNRTGNIVRAVKETISHTGAALFIAALTTAAGFGILVLAPMPPEQQFGIITALVIIYAYITTILILPPILKLWGKYRKRKKGYVISPNDQFYEEK